MDAAERLARRAKIRRLLVSYETLINECEGTFAAYLYPQHPGSVNWDAPTLCRRHRDEDLPALRAEILSLADDLDAAMGLVEDLLQQKEFVDNATFDICKAAGVAHVLDVPHAIDALRKAVYVAVQQLRWLAATHEGDENPSFEEKVLSIAKDLEASTASAHASKDRCPACGTFPVDPMPIQAALRAAMTAAMMPDADRLMAYMPTLRRALSAMREAER